IMTKSIIAKGAPNLAGSHKTHGAPLGEEEVREAKKAIGVPEDSTFYIPEEAGHYFSEKNIQWEKEYQAWLNLFSLWSKENPGLVNEWKQFFEENNLDEIEFPQYQEGDKIATRKASGEVLNAIARRFPNMIGGSADLAPSNVTNLKGMGS
ncbi:unnamed protein product, partial [marine sediment metagenome]